MRQTLPAGSSLPSGERARQVFGVCKATSPRKQVRAVGGENYSELLLPYIMKDEYEYNTAPRKHEIAPDAETLRKKRRDGDCPKKMLQERSETALAFNTTAVVVGRQFSKSQSTPQGELKTSSSSRAKKKCHTSPPAASRRAVPRSTHGT